MTGRRGGDWRRIAWRCVLDGVSGAARTYSRNAEASTLWLVAASAGFVLGWSAKSVLTDRRAVIVSPGTPVKTTQHKALALGMPNNMSVFHREAFVMAFDWRTRNPLWVCQHLNRDSLQRKKQNDVSRKQVNFVVDTEVPEPFRKSPTDFRKTRFDRGHLAPAGDACTQKELEETFLLSNISPQVGKGFNRTYWNRLEMYIRRLANEFDDVFVVTGPLYLARDPPVSSNSRRTVRYEVIGKDVAVPTHFFKSIVCVKNTAFFGKHYSTANFILPNAPIASEAPLKAFKATLEELESKAGLQLWPNVRDRGTLSDLCQETSCELQPLKIFKQAQASAA